MQQGHLLETMKEVEASLMGILYYDYYRGDIGDYVNYLEIDKFNTVFSSGPIIHQVQVSW